jgi:hypothetical protein
VSIVPWANPKPMAETKHIIPRREFGSICDVGSFCYVELTVTADEAVGSPVAGTETTGTQGLAPAGSGSLRKIGRLVMQPSKKPAHNSTSTRDLNSKASATLFAPGVIAR